MDNAEIESGGRENVSWRTRLAQSAVRVRLDVSFAVIDAFVKCAFTMREWVGPETELCFDFHGKMTPGLAIEICNELKAMRPMFVEEPVPQENVDALKLVSDHVPFPIATGERLLTRWGFREIFEKQAVSLIQPDASHGGASAS